MNDLFFEINTKFREGKRERERENGHATISTVPFATMMMMEYWDFERAKKYQKIFDLVQSCFIGFLIVLDLGSTDRFTSSYSL